MKYGILTFHNIPNIGALLQAYSLCKAVRSFGADCEIIDYKCDKIEERELIYKRRPNILKDLILRAFWHKTKKKIKLCQAYMRSKHVYSEKTYNASNINQANKEYDCFISGSDMIWNLEITGHDFNFLLSFADNEKNKFSYGSSIGDKWNSKDIDKVKCLLSRYNALSAREKDTCNNIESMGLKCKHVIDPTMLIRTEDWVTEAIEPKYKGYVLLYFTSKEIIKSARKYAKKHRLKIVHITTEVSRPGIISVSPNTPPEWIGLFLKADAIFTNSYHGLLFSLYFKKPVWTANYGNRITSLLETLNITHRLLKKDLTLQSSIDYNDITKKIELLRQDSLNYLKNALCL